MVVKPGMPQGRIAPVVPLPTAAPTVRNGVATDAVIVRSTALDPDSQYLNAIGKHSLLTAEDEVVLAQRIEIGLEAQQRIEQGKCNGRRERYALERDIRAGTDAREAFLSANLRLVVAYARKYSPAKGMDFLDLVQEGNLGLIRAVDKYDWRKGFKFSTYATWWIRQAITRAIADTSRSIRLPVHVHDTVKTVLATKARLRATYGTAPTVSQLVQETGVTADKVRLALSISDLVSLESPIGADGALLGDFVEDPNADDPEAIAANGDAARVLRSAIARLPANHARLVTLRYGLDSGNPLSRDEIGKEFGLSRERIRQIERNALSRLRHPSSGIRLHNLLS